MRKANLNPTTNLAIEQFILKHEINKDGQEYSTVASTNDARFLHDFLPRFCDAFVEIFRNKNLAKTIFNERLMLIDAIRFDGMDQHLMPLKFAYDDMKEHCNGKLEGGLLMPMYGDGVILLDMDFMKLTKSEAIHTLIHELVHAMTITLQKDENGNWYQIGVQEKNSKVLKRLNEGITEVIAQKIWKIMHSRIKCPGIGRYGLEVEAAKKIIGQFDDEKQFIEDYIVDANNVLNQMKDMIDSNDNSLYDFIKSFENKDIYDGDIQREFVCGVDKFKANQNELINI